MHSKLELTLPNPDEQREDQENVVPRTPNTPQTSTSTLGRMAGAASAASPLAVMAGRGSSSALAPVLVHAPVVAPVAAPASMAEVVAPVRRHAGAPITGATLVRELVQASGTGISDALNLSAKALKGQAKTTNSWRTRWGGSHYLVVLGALYSRSQGRGRAAAHLPNVCVCNTESLLADAICRSYNKNMESEVTLKLKLKTYISVAIQVGRGRARQAMLRCAAKQLTSANGTLCRCSTRVLLLQSSTSTLP